MTKIRMAWLLGLAAAWPALLLLTVSREALHAQATQVYNDAKVTPFTCRITAQTTTKECKALTAGMKAYVTDVVFTNNFAGVQNLKLVTGTGSDCGTGTADLTHAIGYAAAGNFNMGPWNTPLQPAAAGLAICVSPSAAQSYSATVGGFVGP